MHNAIRNIISDQSFLARSVFRNKKQVDSTIHTAAALFRVSFREIKIGSLFKTRFSITLVLSVKDYLPLINTSSSYERTAVVFKTIFSESKKRKKEIKHSVFGEPSGVVSHLVDEIRK